MTKQQALKIAKPIILDTDMILTLLDGTKTTMRKLVKPQPPKEKNGTYERMDNGNFQLKVVPYEDIYDYEIKPPYNVGDLIYVRETWSKINDVYVYKAERQPPDVMFWQASSQMPKEAARFFLRVTDIQVKRLQDMKLDDFIAEGIWSKAFLTKCFPYKYTADALWHARDEYEEIWNSKIKKVDLDNYGWDANPWVLVITFKREEVTA